MRKLFTVALFVLCFGQYAYSQQSKEAAEILNTEKKIANAVIKTDTLIVSSLLSPQYTCTLPDGKMITKQRFIKDIAEWWRPVSIEHAEQKVFLYKETAIVPGKATYRWKNKDGVIEEAVEQYTDTYISKTKNGCGLARMPRVYQEGVHNS
ncbi:MAG: hypothetical protein K2X48_13025 [Chitinophagaceae bacterium]|nr:hypothetical protein [Chitinophagaceae bacterium]